MARTKNDKFMRTIFFIRMDRNQWLKFATKTYINMAVMLKSAGNTEQMQYSCLLINEK